MGSTEQPRHSLDDEGQPGADGRRWAFIGTHDGPMLEVVKIEPDGTIAIAPHATRSDLENAIRTLAEIIVADRGIPDAHNIHCTLSIDVQLGLT